MYVVSHHTLPFVKNGKEVKPGATFYPDGTLETLDEALTEAEFRMRQPQRAMMSEITIRGLEDGTILHRWVYDDTTGEWQAHEAGDSF